MSEVLHVQQSLSAAPERVFQALIDPRELEVWFAEHAEVSLEEAQFDFWGRYTPEIPSREDGRHRVLAVEPGRLLRFEWRLGGESTAVTIRFFPRPDGAAVGVWHRGLPSLPYGFEDVWFLALENLRRHLEGRDVVRCDFTTVPGDAIRHTVEIAAPASAVWADWYGRTSSSAGSRARHGWTFAPGGAGTWAGERKEPSRCFPSSPTGGSSWRGTSEGGAAPC